MRAIVMLTVLFAGPAFAGDNVDFLGDEDEFKFENDAFDGVDDSDGLAPIGLPETHIAPTPTADGAIVHVDEQEVQERPEASTDEILFEGLAPAEESTAAVAAPKAAEQRFEYDGLDDDFQFEE